MNDLGDNTWLNKALFAVAGDPNSALAELAIRPYQDKLNRDTQFAGSRVAVRVGASLDAQDRAYLQDVVYPFLNITFQSNLASSHGLAMSRRLIEQELVIRKCISSEQVCDVGGNWAVNLRMGRTNLHSCCPSIDVRDAQRQNTRELETRRWTDKVIDKYATEQATKATRIATERYINATKFLKDPSWLYCRNRAEECPIAATTVLFNDSLYDMSLATIAAILDAKSPRVAYGNITFSPEMFYSNKGFIRGMNCYWEQKEVEEKNYNNFGLQYKKKIKYLEFFFKECTNITYRHRYDDILILATQQFVRTPQDRAYLIERTYNNGIMNLIFTRVYDFQENTCLSFRMWREEVKGKTLVRLYEFKGVDLDYRSAGISYTDALIETSLYEGALAYALRLENDKFTEANIFSYTCAKNARMTVNGVDVTVSKSESITIAHKLSFTLWFQAFMMKYSNTMIHGYFYNREMHGRSLRDASWKRVLWMLLVDSVSPGVYNLTYGSGEGTCKEWIAKIRNYLSERSVENETVPMPMADIPEPTISIEEWVEKRTEEYEPLYFPTKEYQQWVDYFRAEGGPLQLRTALSELVTKLRTIDSQKDPNDARAIQNVMAAGLRRLAIIDPQSYSDPTSPWNEDEEVQRSLDTLVPYLNGPIGELKSTPSSIELYPHESVSNQISNNRSTPINVTKVRVECYDVKVAFRMLQRFGKGFCLPEVSGDGGLCGVFALQGALNEIGIEYEESYIFEKLVMISQRQRTNWFELADLIVFSNTLNLGLILIIETKDRITNQSNYVMNINLVKSSDEFIVIYHSDEHWQYLAMGNTHELDIKLLSPCNTPIPDADIPSVISSIKELQDLETFEQKPEMTPPTETEIPDVETSDEQSAIKESDEQLVKDKEPPELTTQLMLPTEGSELNDPVIDQQTDEITSNQNSEESPIDVQDSEDPLADIGVDIEEISDDKLEVIGGGRGRTEYNLKSNISIWSNRKVQNVLKFNAVLFTAFILQNLDEYNVAIDYGMLQPIPEDIGFLSYSIRPVITETVIDASKKFLSLISSSFASTGYIGRLTNIGMKFLSPGLRRNKIILTAATVSVAYIFVDRFLGGGRGTSRESNKMSPNSLFDERVQKTIANARTHRDNQSPIYTSIGQSRMRKYVNRTTEDKIADINEVTRLMDVNSRLKSDQLERIKIHQGMFPRSGPATKVNAEEQMSSSNTEIKRSSNNYPRSKVDLERIKEDRTSLVKSYVTYLMSSVENYEKHCQFLWSQRQKFGEKFFQTQFKRDKSTLNAHVLTTSTPGLFTLPKCYRDQNGPGLSLAYAIMGKNIGTLKAARQIDDKLMVDSDPSTIMIFRGMLEYLDFLTLNAIKNLQSIKEIDPTRTFRLVDGVPGCAKSTEIATTVKAGDMIAVASRAANSELQQKLTDRNKSASISRTIGSRIIGRKEICTRMFVDEGLKVHPGELIILAELSSCREMVVFGDSKQNRFKPRVPGYEMPNTPVHWTIELRTESKTMTRDAVIAVGRLEPRGQGPVCDGKGYYPNGITTINPVEQSMHVQEIYSAGDVPKLPRAKYLTFTQDDKHKLLTSGFKGVNTIDEFQGGRNNHVILVRLNRNMDVGLRTSSEQYIVAVSRHTERLDYYTVEQPSTLQDLVYINIKRVKAITNLGNAYGAFTGDVTNKMTTKTQFENLTLNGGGKPVGLTNRAPLLSINTCLQELIPGSGVTSMEFDNTMIEYQELKINCDGKFRVPLENVPAVLKSRKTLKPKVLTSMPPPRPTSFKQCLLALIKRNMGGAHFASPMDYKVFASKALTQMLDVFGREDWRQIVNSWEKIVPNEQELIEWEKVQNTSTLSAMERMDEHTILTTLSESIDDYQFILKPMPKAATDAKPFKVYPTVQTVMFHNKLINSYFGPMIRRADIRFRSLLREDVLYNKGKNLDYIESFLRTHFVDNKAAVTVENDFGDYDRSQREVAHCLDEALLELLGLTAEDVELWMRGHNATTNYNFKLGLRVTLLYQRKSGDVTTAFGNTVLNMTALAFGLRLNRGEVFSAMFLGDDSWLQLKASKGLTNRTKECSERIAVHFNGEAKTAEFKTGYFCGNYIVMTRDGPKLMADPIKRAVKLGRWDVKSVEILNENWISFKDLLRNYEDEECQEMLTDAVCERMPKASFGCVKLLVESLNSLRLSFKEFRNCYEGEVTETPY